MRARFIVWAAGIGSVAIILTAMCVTLAQNPHATRVPRVAPSTVYDSHAPSISPETFPGPPVSIVPGATPASAATRSALIELRSGLALEGHLRCVPIPCQAVFGQASLPLETILGIRMSDELTSVEGGEPRPAGATIILSNGDSLTGMPQIEVLHLQTEWGEAIVKLSHLKSLLLTGEKVIWEEHDGRWRLTPAPTPTEDRETPAESADSAAEPAGAISGIVAPLGTVPPPGTRGTPPTSLTVPTESRQ